MYRLVFLECNDGKHLTRQNGPWHPDFVASKRWYDYWIGRGYPSRMLRMEHIGVSDDGKSTVSIIDPDTYSGGSPGGGSKAAPDADLLAALSSMA